MLPVVVEVSVETCVQVCLTLRRWRHSQILCGFSTPTAMGPVLIIFLVHIFNTINCYIAHRSDTTRFSVDKMLIFVGMSGLTGTESPSEVLDNGARALKLQTDTPHLVNIGGDRLSTSVTLHPIPQGSGITVY
jgi:hypothetical protein